MIKKEDIRIFVDPVWVDDEPLKGIDYLVQHAELRLTVSYTWSGKEFIDTPKSFVRSNEERLKNEIMHELYGEIRYRICEIFYADLDTQEQKQKLEKLLQII